MYTLLNWRNCTVFCFLSFISKSCHSQLRDHGYSLQHEINRVCPVPEWPSLSSLGPTSTLVNLDLGCHLDCQIYWNALGVGVFSPFLVRGVCSCRKIRIFSSFSRLLAPDVVSKFVSRKRWGFFHSLIQLEQIMQSYLSFGFTCFSVLLVEWRCNKYGRRIHVK